MARSLTLGAWLALRRGGHTAVPPPERPALGPGERLVWLHGSGSKGALLIPALSGALAADGQKARIVVTLDDPGEPASGPLTVALPPDYRQPVRAFLDAFRPDVLVWAGAPLRPVLLSEMRERPMLRLLVDADEQTLTLAEGGWIPGAVSGLLPVFHHMLAVDHLTAQTIERLGIKPDHIEVTGTFEPLLSPLPCNERDRRDLAATIGPRPVWHAASVPMAELHDVIAAHRHAARAMHRLLLILAPARAADMAAMAETLRDSGLRVALRADGEEPAPSTEVYLAEGPGEAGLWYRLAPVSYLGGTLTGGATDHPFEAAALGSAILHGTRTSPHAEAFARLTRAGAARALRSGQALGHAVEALLAADRAAAMAAAAWEVTTTGAVVANRIAGLIRERAEAA
ncbi:MAG: 3-deoxy-D-manno-octulosonic acid transferase [Rubellimicrobium sp.]|nr:3-deoxy-D-manno-octulosonic acid transferase [Rubellimicrobium sp.]